MRHYMIVANQTLGGEELIQAIRDRLAAGPCEFWVVVPATPVNELAPGSVPMVPMPVMGGVLSLPAPKQARRLAQDRLQSELRRLKGVGATADGEVGDADPICAVEAALTKRKFDEIIVATLSDRLSRWLHMDLPRRIEHHFHVPVTHVCVSKAPRR